MPIRFRSILLLVASVSLFLPILSAQGLKAELEGDYKDWIRCDVDNDILFTPYTTRSDFSVTVAYRGSPMPGVPLALKKQGDSSNAATIKTDSKGTARFSAIPAGEYYLSVEELLAPNFVGVTVDPHARDNDKIAFEWPNVEASARTLYGTLLVPRTKVPLEGAQVELLELRRSRVILQTYTDSNGHYLLDAPAHGVYVLRFRPNANSEAFEDFGVDFSDESKNEELPAFQLESNDCGVFLAR